MIISVGFVLQLVTTFCNGKSFPAILRTGSHEKNVIGSLLAWLLWQQHKLDAK
jgi:hypothetical protein